jgi:glycosyltransferase involved in cell wall biosynthesis
MQPFVSCVMATGNRRAFFRQALRGFFRQTYIDSELIVVDDGEQPVEDLCLGNPRVVYLRLDRKTNLGAKLNLGIQAAKGELIQKLDDDDYYAPEFLDVASGPFRNREADPAHAIVAWDCFIILLSGSSTLRFSGHGWKAGGTLCFSKEMWLRAPFRDIPQAVDHYFIQDNQPDLTAICAPDYYMLVRHGRNTWTAFPSGAAVDPAFTALPIYPLDLRTLVGDEDYDFYRVIAAGNAQFLT